MIDPAGDFLIDHSKMGPHWQPYPRLKPTKKRRKMMEAAAIRPPRIIHFRERTERQRREAAADPKLIPALLRQYFKFDPMWFHTEMIARLFRGHQGQRKHVFNLPTDHAKSLCTTFFFPLLSLMNDPDEAHGICGVNISDSKRRLHTIQREIESNVELVRDFPWIGRPTEKASRLWSALQMNVIGRSSNKPNPSVLATAIGSGDIKGRRMKLIIDDAETEEHRHSPWKREQLYDFIKLEAVRCFEDAFESSRPALANVGTPFDPNSVHFQLEKEGWAVLRVPVYVRNRIEGRVSTDPRENILNWPAKLEKVHSQYRSMNKIQFAIAYLMDPSGGDPSMMSYQQIAELAAGAEFEMPERSLTLVSLDPASGSTARRADYAGVAVVKVVWGGGEDLPLVDVLHAERVTGGLYEQVHLCADLAAEYQCPIIYEANSQQGNNYAEVFARVRPEATLIRHYTSERNKMDEKLGLTVIRTLLKASRLRVQASKLEVEGIKVMLAEISTLGQQRAHDHICAAVWFVIHHAYEKARVAPNIVNGWGMVAADPRRDLIDREPVFGKPPAVSGVNRWAVAPYRRFK